MARTSLGIDVTTVLTGSMSPPIDAGHLIGLNRLTTKGDANAQIDEDPVLVSAAYQVRRHLAHALHRLAARPLHTEPTPDRCRQSPCRESKKKQSHSRGHLIRSR